LGSVLSHRALSPFITSSPVRKKDVNKHQQSPSDRPMQISYLHQSQGRSAKGLPLKNLEDFENESFDRSCHVLEAVRKLS
jgi:hypothetical protein